MPQGTRKIVDSSLAKHEEDLLTNRNITGDCEIKGMLDLARDFSRRWAYTSTHSRDLRQREILTSSSACFEGSRSDGGTSALRL